MMSMDILSVFYFFSGYFAVSSSTIVTSGIRLGTPAATSRGLKEDDFDKVAEAIAMIIKEGESAVEPAKAIIKTLTDKYPLAF